MNLVEVDVVSSEPAKAVINLGHDDLAREACTIWTLSHPAVDLGRNHDVCSFHIEVAQGTAKIFLTSSKRVHICCIEEVDSEV